MERCMTAVGCQRQSAVSAGQISQPALHDIPKEGRVEKVEEKTGLEKQWQKTGAWMEAARGHTDSVERQTVWGLQSREGQAVDLGASRHSSSKLFELGFLRKCLSWRPADVCSECRPHKQVSVV
jgi:hypothetical protein